jgi:glycerophosphoryl diester phosphodiesterase
MKWIICIAFAFILASCASDLDIVVPTFDDKESLLKKAKPLDPVVMNNSEGVYSLSQGNTSFGDSVVLKWNNGKPTILCGKNAAFFILDAGELGDSIIFEGYWRNAYGAETGRARLAIPDGGGAKALLAGSMPSEIFIRGFTGTENGPLDKPIVMRFARVIKPAQFLYHIIGHRGGGRNSDLHPFSENSVEMIRFAERLGCTGVEIDVRLTKDSVPMLYHDELMNTRLLREDYLVGPFSDYYYGQIRKFATLINGEEVPTFKDALETVLTETKLSFVWIDIKTPDVVAAIAPIVKSYKKKAEDLGRKVTFLMGLPTDEMYNAYMVLPAPRPDALCELDVDKVRNSDARVWSPRWTLGTQLDLVRQMHAEDRRAFVWTLDVVSFINEFMRDGEFDGILTNYPSVVAYNYYIRK